MGIVVVTGLVPAEIGLTVAGSACRARDLILAAGSSAGQHHLRILQAILRHQCIKLSGILRSDAHTAMRNGASEILHLITAVDGVTILHKEN